MKSIRADRQAAKCNPASDDLEVKKLSLETALKALLQLREIRISHHWHVLLHSGRSCNGILEWTDKHDVVSIGQDSNRGKKLCDMEEQGVDTVAEKHAGGDIALTDARESKVSRVSIVAGEVGGEQTEMLARGQACAFSDAPIKVVATRTSLDCIEESLAASGVEDVSQIHLQYCKRLLGEMSRGSTSKGRRRTIRELLLCFSKKISEYPLKAFPHRYAQMLDCYLHTQNTRPRRTSTAGTQTRQRQPKREAAQTSRRGRRA
ncbi:hypothetical protein GUITHDRAFT_118648 [Guillardia theta CCMP2712]|uniref:Uncharacterized protein n=1 Tax=Guillardia theta (strain CCMP2712) TaxID=905079 RepID=L1IG29_GUITC|nr:hypothetical protein GUITHDRAFT_118648 [Guillardia theta CCMP2712]EKX35203.1 hypothetical protein GUITHDRAFT_118648 [Guillardia theta CCMP2712]|eukprot:XP_005822183.1 hypothetical protein GUITHDRAFT_118648 [Guillardia theta CCMP2712]